MLRISRKYRDQSGAELAALTGALPEVLTGKSETLKAETLEIEAEKTEDRGEVAAKSAKKAGYEMAALAGKVAAGTATKAEKARLRVLLGG